MDKIYRGIRPGLEGGGVVVEVVEKVELAGAVAEKVRSLRHEMFHSPDGFEWGYGGSGPADLALSILMDEGLTKTEAWHFHQQFKADVIARLPRHGFSLGSTEVQAWIVRHGHKKQGG